MNTKKLLLMTSYSLLIVLLISSCASSAQSIPANKVPIPTATIHATPFPVITLPPITTPTSIPSSTSVSHSILTSWKDIPIMPGAISAQDLQDSYQFTTKASIKDIATFYGQGLPKLGWEPQDTQDPSDTSHGHFSFTKANQTVVFEIFSQGSGMYMVSIYIAQM